MAPDVRIFYTARYQGTDHTFEFRLKNMYGNAWRAYIVSLPDFHGRSDAYEHTHLVTTSEGRSLCWDKPVNKAELKQVVAFWCRCMAYYIHNGGEFFSIVSLLQGKPAA